MVSKVWARPLVALVATLAIGGCQSNPTEPVIDPAVEAQLRAIRGVLAAERLRTAGAYDSLLAVWTARQSRPPMAASGSTDGFIPCAPLPYASDAQVVGPSGGTLYFGPHKLTVPPGALSSAVALGVMVKPDLKTEVTLLPHGTQFAVPVKLSLSYGNCQDAASHRVAYVDLLDQVLEWTSATDYPQYSKIVARLGHFSQYAIAY